MKLNILCFLVFIIIASNTAFGMKKLPDCPKTEHVRSSIPQLPLPEEPLAPLTIEQLPIPHDACSANIAPKTEKPIDQQYAIRNQYLSEAYTALCSGNLDLLDAYVGDTDCNMRALIILKIYQDLQAHNFNLNTLNNIQKEFLALCRLLNATKQTSYKINGTIHQTVTRHHVLNIKDKLKCKIFIKQMRDRLTLLTVLLMQENAAQLKDKELITYTTSKSNLAPRPIAYYPGFKILLLSCLQQKIPLLIRIHKKIDVNWHALNFFYKPINNKYVLSISDEYPNNQAILFINGYSDSPENKNKDGKDYKSKESYIGDICERSIEETLLINAAAHTQYLDRSDIPFSQLNLHNLKQEINTYKLLADTGYTAQNSTVLVIDHMSAQTLSNIRRDNQELYLNTLRRERISKHLPTLKELLPFIFAYERGLIL
jgi:hypothetical protein